MKSTVFEALCQPALAQRLQVGYLPTTPLYASGATPANSAQAAAAIGWALSPTPFFLSSMQMETLSRLGIVLLRFMQACDRLYFKSGQNLEKTTDPVPGWLMPLLDQGKPEALLKLASMKRFRQDLPLVIRPDLLITDDGFALCEIDAVPGGLGFLSALNQAYAQSGFDVIAPPDGMPTAFLDCLKACTPDIEKPVITVVLSDEAADYRLEMQWLSETIQAQYPDFYLLHPNQIDMVRDRLVFQNPHGQETAIDLIYRFFELFDLPNIPKIELIQYAVKKGLVQCTPPFKPHLEEKLWLGLLHHPMLQPHWQAALGQADAAWLQQLVPQTWILDPAPLPSQAVIPGLMPAGQAMQSFEDLKTLSQKQRRLVIKPSGFSPLAWGSRGVTIGHDVNREDWQAALDIALGAFAQTPYLLQEFKNPSILPFSRLDPETGTITPFDARIRLCPYYLVRPDLDQVQLIGVLATACPADKKIIHGMRDAIMAPCAIREGNSSL